VLNAELKRHSDNKIYGIQDLQIAANKTISAQLQYTAIPKRFTIAIREIWELQQRLQRRNKRSILSAFNHPRFRAAYDFLLLREESGEQLNELGKWWTYFQISDTNQQSEMISEAACSSHTRRRNRRKPAGGNR